LYPEETAAPRQQSHEKEKPMMLATVRMTIPSQKSGEVLKILRLLAEHCRYEPGCLSCHLYGDLQEKNVFVLEQVWRAQEDLDLHLRSGEYLNLLLVLEMSLKEPEVRFDTILSSTGMETIEKARSCAR